MSWSISYPSREDFVADRRSDPNMRSNTTEVDAQIRAARAAAAAVIDSGTVGQDANVPQGRKDFAISISGHANPGHEPAQGWANDCINISISQKTKTE